MMKGTIIYTLTFFKFFGFANISTGYVVEMPKPPDPGTQTLKPKTQKRFL
jgi:hypothetical protein